MKANNNQHCHGEAKRPPERRSVGRVAERDHLFDLKGQLRFQYVLLGITDRLVIALLLLLPVLAKSQVATNHNPLLADPTILLHKGIYYLYGTNDRGSNNGFTAYTSKDLQVWKAAGTVLSPGEAYGSKGFWAPQVFEWQGKFYMAYTANEHIAIAVADHPLGPFRQKEIKPIDTTEKMIDPFIFFDGNKIYLYYVRLHNGNRIYVAEMQHDLSGIKKATAVECIHAGAGWENSAHTKWGVTEGPSVLKRNGRFYMFYSANDFRNPGYAVGIATSVTPTGPWKKYNRNPVISKDIIGINGTGHGDVFVDKAGQWWYVLHTHYSQQEVSPRKTALIGLQFTDTIKALPGSFRFLASIP